MVACGEWTLQKECLRGRWATVAGEPLQLLRKREAGLTVTFCGIDCSSLRMIQFVTQLLFSSITWLMHIIDASNSKIEQPMIRQRLADPPSFVYIHYITFLFHLYAHFLFYNFTSSFRRRRLTIIWGHW